MAHDTEIFEANRPTLLALGYRMLGELSRAEDAVQEAWLRWTGRSQRGDVQSPKAFLLTTVARICLDELGSARARREESRSDRLPELVDLQENGLSQLETLDRISAAFLVLLQRLSPSERAVLLLHDVLDSSHAEIAAMLGKTDAASRQLLARAREHVAAEKRTLQTSTTEQRRLLRAFVRAVNEGRRAELLELLAEDAMLIADAGPEGGRFGKIRNLGKPLIGPRRIAALMSAFARQAEAAQLVIHERTLNGEPAVVAVRAEQIQAAIAIAVLDGKIQRIFVQNDPERLRRLTSR